MTGNDILHSTSVSPTVLYSQQLPSTDTALYTVPTNQSARVFQGTLCNSSSSQSPPTLAIASLYAQLTAPTLTAGTTNSSGGTFAAATYYWKITAITLVGETTGSAEVSKAVDANGTQALSWTVVGGATGYKIYRGTASNTQNVLVTTISSGATTSYLDTGSSTGAATVPGSNTSGGGSFSAGTYFWVLTAVSSAGETIASNEITSPVGANGSIVFSWGIVPAATSYKLYRGTSTGGENVLIATLGSLVTTTSDTGTAGSAASPPGSSTFGMTATVSLSITKSGGSLDSTHRIVNNMSVAADATVKLNDILGGAMLGPGDFIAGKSSVAGAVVLVLTGTVHV